MSEQGKEEEEEGWGVHFGIFLGEFEGSEREQ